MGSTASLLARRWTVALALSVLLLGAAALTAAAKPHHGKSGHGHGAGAKGGKGGKGGLAHAQPLLPPKGKIFTGTSDTGQTSDFRQYQRESASHPAVLQAFESWGYVPREAINRWADTRSRGMLSLSTSPCWMCNEKITPQSIANGKGDRYLLSLAAALVKRKKPTYIRLFPEMNGSWNRYGAYTADGKLRDKAHSTKQFRNAWRRFVLIVRGGEVRAIDQALHKLHMPKIRGKVKSHLPEPKVAFVWVPQSTGSPNVKGNAPRDYFPGWDYVDWVGADLYGKFPNFAGLNALYKQFPKAPFLIGEWSSWDVDNPGFVKQLFSWIEHHPRARMALNYQGFGEGEDNPFELSDYGKSRQQLKHVLNANRYAPFAPENEQRKGVKGGGKGNGKGPKHPSKGGKHKG